jgi:AcrR family transcriptional regulator
LSSISTDPRIERTRRAVLEATLEVLGARGYAAFTVEAVAEAGRVAKSTIYRHWPTKLGLIADALETLNEQPGPRPTQRTTGTARERVEQLMVHLAEAMCDSTLSACLPALIESAEHHAEVARFLHGYSARRRQALVDALRAGVEAGELPAYVDPELAAAALSGAVFYRRLITPDRLSPAEVRELVTQVLGPA